MQTHLSHMNRQQFFEQMCAQEVRERQRVNPCYRARANPSREAMNQTRGLRQDPSLNRNLTGHCGPWIFRHLRESSVHTPSTVQCWKTSFKTEVCSGSNYPSEFMGGIKEGEMAISVDDLKTSRSISGQTVSKLRSA